MSTAVCQPITQLHELLQLGTLYVIYEHFTKSPLVDYQKSCYICSDPDTAAQVASRFGRYQIIPKIRDFKREEIPNLLHLVIDLLGASIQFCTPEDMVKLEDGSKLEFSWVTDRNKELLFLLTVFTQEQRMRNRQPEQYMIIQHYHDEIQKAMRYSDFLIPVAQERIVHTLSRLGEIAIPLYTDVYHLQQKYPVETSKAERCTFRKLLTMPTEHFIINPETIAYQLGKREVARILQN